MPWPGHRLAGTLPLREIGCQVRSRAHTPLTTQTLLPLALLPGSRGQVPWAQPQCRTLRGLLTCGAPLELAASTRLQGTEPCLLSYRHEAQGMSTGWHHSAGAGRCCSGGLGTTA